MPERIRKTVPMSTLDNVLGERAKGKKCFVLVDIEGSEDMMLQGAKKMLSLQPRPIWMVEISTTEHQPEGVKVNPDLLSTFRRFWEKGYEGCTADQRMKTITEEEIKNICKNGKNTLLTNNFLFFDKGQKKIIF